MPGGNGSNSKRQTNKTHHGGLSQSGSQRYGGAPKPARGNGGKPGGGMSLGEVLFGKGPVQWGHGGSKKNRNKGKGSR